MLVHKTFQSTVLNVINVFENENVLDISHQFCVEKGWELNDTRCLNVGLALTEEERRMRDHGQAKGGIRYNLELDNDIQVPFNVDDQQFNVTVAPLENAEA